MAAIFCSSRCFFCFACSSSCRLLLILLAWVCARVRVDFRVYAVLLNFAVVLCARAFAAAATVGVASDGWLADACRRSTTHKRVTAYREPRYVDSKIFARCVLAVRCSRSFAFFYAATAAAAAAAAASARASCLCSREYAKFQAQARSSIEQHARIFIHTPPPFFAISDVKIFRAWHRIFL